MVKDCPGKLQIAICHSEKDLIGPSGQDKFDYGHCLANGNVLGWSGNETNYPYRKIIQLKRLSVASFTGDSKLMHHAFSMG